MQKLDYYIAVVGKASGDRLVSLLQFRKEVSGATILANTSELKAVLKGSIDLLFIKARDWDYKVVSALNECKTQPVIVWLSGEHDKCVDELHAQVAFHFREPLFQTDLDKLFGKLKGYTNDTTVDFLFIKFNHRYIKIWFDEILFAERKLGAHYNLVTEKESYLVNGTLVQLIKKLPVDNFKMVAVNLIVNVNLLHLVKNGVFRSAKGVVNLSDRKLPVRYFKYRPGS